LTELEIDEGLASDDARTFDDSEACPLRVLHVHSGNMYGGVEKMLSTGAQLRQLVPSLETSFALCFAGRFSEELKATGAAIHWLEPARVRNPFSIRRARKRLREILRRESFDVVVAHSSWSQAIFGPVVRKAKLTLVLHLHGASDGRHWLERWARRAPPDFVICNSRHTAETLSKLYTNARSDVLYCPVAAPADPFSDAEREATRAEFKTGPDATVIIQASRMEAWKGQMLHLEALSLLKDVQGWVCWMVGGAQRASEREYESELKRATERLGLSERVRFLGQRDDVQKLLAAADIYCQPNTGPEPFGISFIEALYASLPVVTTAFGGACEIVDQSCGMLVPTNDAPALAKSLRRLIEDRTLRAELGIAGPIRARQLCDPATQMKRLHQMLASILGQQFLKR
jgi:glycosyltransferase involved in cell wall biosynthesis